jgi:hypothetical protein
LHVKFLSRRSKKTVIARGGCADIGLVVRDAQSDYPLEIREIGEIRELQISAPESYRNTASILNLGGEAPEVLIRRLRDAPA